MRNKFKKETPDGREYVLDLVKDKFIVKDNGRKVLEVETLAHKYKLFGDITEMVQHDLKIAASCLPGVHTKPIMDIIKEVGREYDN